MTTDNKSEMKANIRAGRRRVSRSRGAFSGLLLVILGAWAALVPFFGPALNLGYTPQPNKSWHWTADRGWLEVLPGVAAVLGGLLLLVSASRAMTLFGGWLAALGGAWLIVGPPLADAIGLHPGQPDPSAGTNNRAATSLVYFFAIGAAILFFASVALGRVSVLSVRDVRAAERRAEAEEAERQAALEAAAAQERERRQAEARTDGSARHATGNPAGDVNGPNTVAADQQAPQYASSAPQGTPITHGSQSQPQYAPQAPGSAPQAPPQAQGQYPSAPPPPNREN